MNPPALPIPDLAHKDQEHLRLLAVFHFVLAGLGLLFVPFLFLHYSIMSRVFTSEELWKSQPNAPLPPREIFDMMVWIYWVAGVFLLLALAANAISGICIARRKGRMLSLVVAGFNCVQFPFGTALGVFTFIVLMRESVMALYRRASGSP